MDNTVGRLQSLFPSHQLDVIIGSLLGDARLECRSVGMRNPLTARFRVHHGEKQKEYVFWKYKILEDLVLKEPRESVWDNPKRNLHEISWYFHTKSIKEFGILHGYFYRNGVKILPKNIFHLLTPQMIAVWFMDDGSNNGGNITINTHSFSKEEQLRIIDFLKNHYSIYATVVKDRTKVKLAIGKHEYKKFLTIVHPFIIPSMAYKVVYPRNDLAALDGQSDEIGSLSFR
ncbi:MAG: LAGLIDADG endonuclease [bacterium]|nr:LAGLIDADG endonuclease [bacterium]